MKVRYFFSTLIGVPLLFAVLMKGAHDLWAATAVYLFILTLVSCFIVFATWIHPEKIRIPLIGPILFLLFALLLSFWQASNPSESFLGCLDWSAAMALCLLSAQIFSSEETTEYFMKLMVPLFWTQAIVLCFQMALAERGAEFNLLGLGEVSGTLMNGNLTAAFLIFWFPPLLEKIRVSGEQKNNIRWYWISGLAGCLCSLLILQSIWAWLVLVGWMFLRRPSRRTLFCLMTVVILALGFLVFKFHTARSPFDRLLWWHSGLNMFLAQPSTGVGIGNFPSAFLAFKFGNGLNSLYAHSFWISLLAETGLIGTVSFLVFFGMFFRLSDKQNPFVQGIILFLLFASVNLGPEALVNLLVLGLFMGIAMARLPSKKIFIRKIGALLVVGGGLCAVPYLLAPFLASRHTVDGESYLGEKAWEQAQKSFEIARSIDDRAWEPYAGLGQVAFEKGNVKEAISYQQEAIRRNRLAIPLQKQLERYQRFL